MGRVIWCEVRLELGSGDGKDAPRHRLSPSAIPSSSHYVIPIAQALLSEVRTHGAAVPEVVWCRPGETGGMDALAVGDLGCCAWWWRVRFVAVWLAQFSHRDRSPSSPHRLLASTQPPKGPTGFLSPARLALYDSKRNDPGEPQVIDWGTT